MPSDALPVPHVCSAGGARSRTPGTGPGPGSALVPALRERSGEGAPARCSPQKRGAALSGGGLHLEDKVGQDGDGSGDGFGKGIEVEKGMGAAVSPVTSQISLETNWISLSRLNPTNVAGFGNRCLHFLRVS